MKKEIIPFGFRIPEELKTKLDEAKDQSRRSLNAEMIVRLEESFRPPLAGYSDGELIAELMRRYERGAIHIRIGRPDEKV